MNWWFLWGPVLLLLASGMLLYQSLLKAAWSNYLGPQGPPIWVVVETTGERTVLDTDIASVAPAFSGLDSHVVILELSEELEGWPFSTKSTLTLSLSIRPSLGSKPIPLDPDLRRQVLDIDHRHGLLTSEARDDLLAGDHRMVYESPTAPVNNFVFWFSTLLGTILSILLVRNIRSKLIRGRRRSRLRKNLCPVCTYDLSGGDMTSCPECGSKWDYDECLVD